MQPNEKFTLKDQWTVCDACRILGVWPGASMAWIEFARDARIQDAQKEQSPWEEESRQIRLCREAATFLLQQTGTERERAFLAEIQHEIEASARAALQTTLEALLLTRPDIAAPAGESHF